MIAQILTTVECCAAILFLHFAYGHDVQTAIAIAIPLTYPLMIIQLIIIYYIYNKYLNERK